MASREFSAGGVVVREHEGRLEVAVIRPAGRVSTALPKGHIDRGETAEQAAAREVAEETGLTARLHSRLGEVRYVYRFQGRTIFKVVSFFLFMWEAGDIGAISEAMKKEVDGAWWVPLEQAGAVLSYPGERQMALKAREALSAREPGS